MTREDTSTRVVWRRSSFSGGGSASGAECVELAMTHGGLLAVRDSKHPAANAVLRAGAELITWVKAR